MIRSLHEASRLVSLVNFQGEEPLLQRWLRERKVERKHIVAALDRQEQAMRVEMIKEGLDPPGTTKLEFDRQYGRWSDFAHHRRPHLLDQVNVEARVMAAGRHPDWRSRAALVDHFGWHVLGLVTAGGSALARLLSPEWFHDRFQPTYRALRALQDKVPLAAIADGSQGEGPPSAPGGADEPLVGRPGTQWVTQVPIVARRCWGLKSQRFAPFVGISAAGVRCGWWPDCHGK